MPAPWCITGWVCPHPQEQAVVATRGSTPLCSRYGIDPVGLDQAMDQQPEHEMEAGQQPRQGRAGVEELITGPALCCKKAWERPHCVCLRQLPERELPEAHAKGSNCASRGCPERVPPCPRCVKSVNGHWLGAGTLLLFALPHCLHAHCPHLTVPHNWQCLPVLGPTHTSPSSSAPQPRHRSIPSSAKSRQLHRVQQLSQSLACQSLACTDVFHSSEKVVTF